MGKHGKSIKAVCILSSRYLQKQKIDSEKARKSEAISYGNLKSIARSLQTGRFTRASLIYFSLDSFFHRKRGKFPRYLWSETCLI